MMQWEKLLSLKKQGDTNKRLRTEQDETRLGFEVDYDRILFSSAFRSLQDKTQVIPFSKTSFVHTRLTHSLEVSVVGRSLGRQVGKAILDTHPQLQKIHGYHFNDFGAIVAAASLAHDIGNPPFGHSGEKAIGTYFEHGKGKRFKTFLNEKEYQDLIDFEGNANGFKLLTENRDGVDGGLRLSYATLGAFTKYPKESLPKKPTAHIADKKFGVFQSEKVFFEEVAQELGLLKVGEKKNLRFARHPLSYLVEAADDICYTIIDFEDGINLGWINEDMALEYLIKLVKDTLNREKYYGLTRASDRLAYLRSLAINALIAEAVAVFLRNEETILAGEFPHTLLSRSRYQAQMDDIIKISVDKIYNSPEVVEKEIAGFKILGALMETFATAFENRRLGNTRYYDELVLKNFHGSFPPGDDAYDYLMASCKHVSALTDGNALRTYKKINGEL